MVTVLTDGHDAAEVDGTVEQDELWLTAADLEAFTGWALKPEGLCRGEVCVPVPPTGPALVRDGNVNVSAFWARLGGPVVTTADSSVWYLGESATVRAGQLDSLEAPDFTLPDLSGRLHSLSDHRGKKVFLATWASW